MSYACELTVLLVVLEVLFSITWLLVCYFAAKYIISWRSFTDDWRYITGRRHLWSGDL